MNFCVLWFWFSVRSDNRLLASSAWLIMRASWLHDDWKLQSCMWVWCESDNDAWLVCLVRGVDCWLVFTGSRKWQENDSFPCGEASVSCFVYWSVCAVMVQSVWAFPLNRVSVPFTYWGVWEAHLVPPSRLQVPKVYLQFWNESGSSGGRAQNEPCCLGSVPFIK